jgi:hypothetical protein
MYGLWHVRRWCEFPLKRQFDTFAHVSRFRENLLKVGIARVTKPNVPIEFFDRRVGRYFSTKEELSWMKLLLTLPDKDNLLSNLILKQFKVLDKVVSLLKSQFIDSKEW